MKILEINKFCYPKRGAEKHFLDVVSLLESEGHSVAIFSMHHSKNIDTVWKKYFVSTVGYTSEYSFWQKIKGTTRMFYSLEAKNKIKKLLDDFNPDIVHVHNIYHQLSPAILFEIKKRNIPIVMTVHDYKIVSPNHSLFLNGEFYDRCKNGRYYECFLDKCVKNSYAKSLLAMLEMYWHEKLGTYKKTIDQYIVPSDFVRKALIERGISSEKISVLPHFICENNSHAKVDIKTIKSVSKPKNPYALYVGAISSSKGVKNLIEIFRKIEGLDLYIAGAIEDDTNVDGISGVNYLGYLNKSRLSNFMSEASCVVSGSRLPETFGLIALEGLSFGKPFFGFKAGAYGEIIKNSENGFLVDSDGDFEKALKDFSSGKVKFDSSKIIEDSEKKHNKEEYYVKIVDLFKRQKKG